MSIYALTEPEFLSQTPITLAQWDEIWSQRDDAYELVDGIPTMAPSKAHLNIDIAVALLDVLRPHLPKRWVARPYSAVLLTRVPRPTVRVPDLVVMLRSPDRSRARVDATEATMVAEVSSPSSVQRALVKKRREYAAAGIPIYLAINPHASPTLRLFTSPRDGDYRTEATGDEVTVCIDEASIQVRAADLLA